MLTKKALISLLTVSALTLSISALAEDSDGSTNNFTSFQEPGYVNYRYSDSGLTVSRINQLNEEAPASSGIVKGQSEPAYVNYNFGTGGSVPATHSFDTNQLKPFYNDYQ